MSLDAGSLASRLAEITSFGPRFSGTPGELAAREYLLREFSAIGLREVGAESFDYLGYEPVSARCVVGGAELACGPLQSTANGTADAPAVFIGAGSEADLSLAGPLAGKVVLAQPANLFACAAELLSHEIAALIYVAPTSSGLIGSFTASLYPPPLEPPWAGRVLPFPGVILEAGAARGLIARMTSSVVHVRVEHQAVYADAVSANVFGSVVGTELPDETVIVGAHYDTQLACPGAWDNGTGLASLLAIAERVAAAPCRRTVRFVCFGVEEPGLWGSYVHTLRLGDGRAGVVGMVNLDTVGAPINGPRVLVASDDMHAVAEAAAQAAGWGPFEWEHPDAQPYFDHTPFADIGVPVACFLQPRLSHPYYHSPGDVPEMVDFDSMALATAAAAATITQLASR